jgi:hypothetical protein
MLWEVTVEIKVILHVEADEEEGARALGGDSLSALHVLESWRDCVTEHDQWWSIDEVESLESSGDVLCQPAELNNHHRSSHETT